jgi:hypothetical protein
MQLKPDSWSMRSTKIKIINLGKNFWILVWRSAWFTSKIYQFENSKTWEVVFLWLTPKTSDEYFRKSKIWISKNLKLHSTYLITLYLRKKVLFEDSQCSRLKFFLFFTMSNLSSWLIGVFNWCSTHFKFSTEQEGNGYKYNHEKS